MHNGGMPKLEISKVHDAYAGDGECPLCALHEAAEATYLHSFQHSRVMEPNVRVQTNAVGFCPDHYGKLYRGENKLGLGLVVHTHLQEKLPEIKAALERIAAPKAGRKARGIAADAAGRLSALRDRCFICDMLRMDNDRYVFTILYLWSKDSEFPARFRASRGFCIGHFLDALLAAPKLLRADRAERWTAEAVGLMTGSLERLERELYSFTQLYRNENTSLGSEAERTALGRTLQKLAGGRFRLE
jgi:hypothetical protein